MGSEKVPEEVVDKNSPEEDDESEESAEAPAEKEKSTPKRKKRNCQTKKEEMEKPPAKIPLDETQTKTEATEKRAEIKQDKKAAEKENSMSKKDNEQKSNWSQFTQEGEGQLAVDVYQTDGFLVMQSAIAGVKPGSLDIVIEGDMVSIKGVRERPEEEGERNYFYQECFWGPFSRQIVLSVGVDSSRTEARLKDGILTIKVPKIEKEKKRKIEVRG